MSSPPSLASHDAPEEADAPAPAAARTWSPAFRRVALTLGCLVTLSALGGAVFAHADVVAPAQSPQALVPVAPPQASLPVLPVTLAGPTDVATASEVSCSRSGANIIVTGTLVATGSEPRGMTVYATVHPDSGGVSIGTSAVVPIPASSVGQARRFRGVISGAGEPIDDRCVVLWVANPAMS